MVSCSRCTTLMLFILKLLWMDLHRTIEFSFFPFLLIICISVISYSDRSSICLEDISFPLPFYLEVMLPLICLEMVQVWFLQLLALFVVLFFIIYSILLESEMFSIASYIIWTFFAPRFLHVIIKLENFYKQPSGLDSTISLELDVCCNFVSTMIFL